MFIDILTALPGIVEGPLQHGIPKRAVQKRLLTVRVHDLRDYATDRHRKVDDYPYGGGAGMVLKPEPIFRCIEALRSTRMWTWNSCTSSKMRMNSFSRRA